MFHLIPSASWHRRSNLCVYPCFTVGDEVLSQRLYYLSKDTQHMSYLLRPCFSNVRIERKCILKIELSFVALTSICFQSLYLVYLKITNNIKGNLKLFTHSKEAWLIKDREIIFWIFWYVLIFKNVQGKITVRWNWQENGSFACFFFLFICKHLWTRTFLNELLSLTYQ